MQVGPAENIIGSSIGGSRGIPWVNPWDHPRKTFPMGPARALSLVCLSMTDKSLVSSFIIPVTETDKYLICQG